MTIKAFSVLGTCPDKNVVNVESTLRAAIVYRIAVASCFYYNGILTLAPASFCSKDIGTTTGTTTGTATIFCSADNVSDWRFSEEF